MDQQASSSGSSRISRLVYSPQPIPDTFAVEEPEDLASIHRKFKSWQEQVECHFQVLRDISYLYCDFPQFRQDFINDVWTCICSHFLHFSPPVPTLEFFNYLIRRYTAMNEEDYMQLCQYFKEKFIIPSTNEEVCPRSLYDQAYRVLSKDPNSAEILEKNDYKPKILS